MPKSIAFVAKIDPLSYGIDGLRSALIGQSYFGTLLDFIILSLVTILLFALGSYLFSKLEA